METALRGLGLPLTLLRPGWFIDNAAWDVASARETGVIKSFLLPTEKKFPMVAARDIGAVAAELIQQDWSGTRVIELEGPYRVSPNDLAKAFASVLGKPVRAEAVPRETWEALFRSQGMKHPKPRMRMLDGFNDGWIRFEDDGKNAIKGSTDVATTIAALISNA
jgi:NAD(P)H dehydrogenase (quinone)